MLKKIEEFCEEAKQKRNNLLRMKNSQLSSQIFMLLKEKKKLHNKP